MADNYENELDVRLYNYPMTFLPITDAADRTPTRKDDKVVLGPVPLLKDHFDLLHAAKLTVPQAAKALGIGDTKMREIIRNGEVPVIRILGKILILDRDLENYLQGNYGALNPTKHEKGSSNNGLPPLPEYIKNWSLIKKAS
jgi:excisionase family DNA binding protein